MSTNRPQNQNQFNWQAFSAPGYDGESSRTIRSDSTQQNTVRTAAQNAINRSRQPDFSRLDNHSNSSLSISSTVASSNSQRPQRSAPKSEPLAPKKNPITLPISEESDDDLAGSVPSWTMNFLPQRPATQPQPSDDTNYPPRNYSTTTARARPDSETGSNQRAFRMNPTTFTGREQAGREQIDENDFENLSMASSSTTSASRPQPQSQARPQPQSQARPQPQSQARPQPQSQARPQSQSRPQENDLERLGTDLMIFLSNIQTPGILENMDVENLSFEMKSLILLNLVKNDQVNLTHEFMKRTNFTDNEKQILEIASNLANPTDDAEQDHSEASESEEYSYQREFSDTRSTESEDDYEEHTHCVHRRAPVQIRTYDCSRAHFCHHGNWH